MNTNQLSILSTILNILNTTEDGCYHCTFTSDFYYFSDLEDNRLVWKTLFEDWFVESIRELGFEIEYGSVKGKEFRDNRDNRDNWVYGEWVDISWDRE